MNRRTLRFDFATPVPFPNVGSNNSLKTMHGSWSWSMGVHETRQNPQGEDGFTGNAAKPGASRKLGVLSMGVLLPHVGPV